MLRQFSRLLFTLMLLTSASAHADEAAAWAALGEGGRIILMRHAATVPGTGDPPGFRLGDCATQRLLSDAGREQAKAIGAALRERGVSADRVLSSAWCRSVDTAELMDVGGRSRTTEFILQLRRRGAAPDGSFERDCRGLERAGYLGAGDSSGECHGIDRCRSGVRRNGGAAPGRRGCGANFTRPAVRTYTKR